MPNRSFNLSAGELFNVPIMLEGGGTNNLCSNSVVEKVGIWTGRLVRRVFPKLHTYTSLALDFADTPTFEFCFYTK